MNGKLSLNFIFATIIVGCIAECIFWTFHFLQRTPNPPLLHPQLLPDLILAIGFYGSFGIVWSFLLKRFNYSLKEVFILQGLFGVFLEQKGAVFLQGLAILPVGIILWFFVCIVYGSFIAIPFQLTKPEVSMHNISLVKRLTFTFIGLMFASYILFGIWRMILLNFLPDPKFLGDFPFW